MKITIILLTCYVLLIHNLGGIALWDPDEPRQAIMAKEMADRHDYIHPYLNGQPYLEKPPFYPWMIIVVSKLKGNLDEFSSRLPAALSATALVLITYYLGCLLMSPQAGLLSALVLATNYQFLSNARESVMDMTFAFFIGLTIFLNYLSITGTPPPTSGYPWYPVAPSTRPTHRVGTPARGASPSRSLCELDRCPKESPWASPVKGKRLYFMLSFIPSALGVLTKGPAGLVLPALTTFIYLISKKELKRFILPFAGGCLVSAAISSIWFLLAGEEYIKEFILRQNITRYTNAFDHIETIFYYFHKLFFNFLPWSMLLPFAICHAIRKKIWFPLIWFTVIFLFFELSKSKRAIYLLSCYPACALLCGIYIKDKWSWLLENTKTNMLIKCFAVILVIIPMLSLVALNVLSSPVVTVFKQKIFSLYPYIAVLILAGGAIFYTVMKKSYALTLSVLFFYFIFMGFFYNAFYMPVMDKYFKSPRLITDQLGGLKDGRDIYTYGFSSAGIKFYIGKPIRAFTNINELKDKKHDILLIAEDEQSQPIQKDLDSLFLPVKKAGYEKEHYTIYVRRDGKQ